MLDDFLNVDRELESLRKLKKEFAREEKKSEAQNTESDVASLKEELQRCVATQDAAARELAALESEERALLEELQLLQRETAAFYLEETDLQDELFGVETAFQDFKETLVGIKAFYGIRELFSIRIPEPPKSRNSPNVGKEKHNHGTICGLRLGVAGTEESWTELSAALGVVALLMQSLISWHAARIGSDAWKGAALRDVVIVPHGARAYLMRVSDAKPLPLHYQPFASSQVASWLVPYSPHCPALS